MRCLVLVCLGSGFGGYSLSYRRKMFRQPLVCCSVVAATGAGFGWGTGSRATWLSRSILSSALSITHIAPDIVGSLTDSGRLLMPEGFRRSTFPLTPIAILAAFANPSSFAPPPVNAKL